MMYDVTEDDTRTDMSQRMIREQTMTIIVMSEQMKKSELIMMSYPSQMRASQTLKGI